MLFYWFSITNCSLGTRPLLTSWVILLLTIIGTWTRRSVLIHEIMVRWLIPLIAFLPWNVSILFCNFWQYACSRKVDSATRRTALASPLWSLIFSLTFGKNRWLGLVTREIIFCLADLFWFIVVMFYYFRRALYSSLNDFDDSSNWLASISSAFWNLIFC